MNGLEPRQRMGFNLIELMITIVLIGSITALATPLVQKTREVEVRTQSINNLKNIALAVHGFHDANKRLPFNGSDAKVGDTAYSAAAKANDFASGSWGFQISIYIDHPPLILSKLARKVYISSFLCPGRKRPEVETSNGGGAWSDYFLNNYLNDPKNAEKPDNPDMRRTMVGVTDGTSNTVFFGHGNISTKQYESAKDVTLCTNIFTGGTIGTIRAGKNGEFRPEGMTLQRDSENAPTLGSWGGPFPHGALVAMGDATVRLFPYDMERFGTFLTPNGGENIPMN